MLAGGPRTYTSGLPLDDCVTALTDAGVPAHVSESAGSYVCNAVFYSLMHDAAARPGIRAGIVHVPAVRGGAGELDVELIARGLVALLHAAAPHAEAA